jgi:sigma-54 specific flagellar transcriptional regulator A
MLPLVEPSRRRSIEALAKLHYSNPFLEERIAREREALGANFRDAPAVRTELDYAKEPNLEILGVRIEEETARMRQRLVEGAGAGDPELAIYEDLVLYLLYRRYRLDLEGTILESTRNRSARVRIPYWDRFLNDTRHFLVLPGRTLPAGREPAHLLADSYQVCRAFAHIFNNIVGTSGRSARLRATVWESIFTHDMRRYRRSLYRCMGDLPTLITGPSGTGKELVARAVALSRYIPFDPKTKEFVGNHAASFHPLNLSALAPTLIESELFGHKKGAFTGALADRKGWLQECGPLDTVFLDEIGDLDMALQLKLLRVLQERTFQRLGESRDIGFEGKFITATHRDLAAEMRARRFRPDLYFRLCADMIVTPSLREQLGEAPGDLHLFILFIARRIKGIPEHEAGGIAREVEQWIRAHPDLGRGYPWPGNFRELEQCVRNVMIRKEYHPAAASEVGDQDPRRALASAVQEGALDLPQLERRYCTLIYSETGDYVKAAERLKIDRRTLKSKLDPEFLERLRG